MPPLPEISLEEICALQRRNAELVAERNEAIVRQTELAAELKVVWMERGDLQAAIRRHRDERGDDRCHADDGQLYSILPEGDVRPQREVAVTIENCQKYIERRQQGREYVSPQRRIEELEAELAQARQSDLGRLVCAFCGFQVIHRDTDLLLAGVAKHVRTCEKHPMQALLRENAQLRAALAEASGV